MLRAPLIDRISTKGSFLSCQKLGEALWLEGDAMVRGILTGGVLFYRIWHFPDVLANAREGGCRATPACGLKLLTKVFEKRVREVQL